MTPRRVASRLPPSAWYPSLGAVLLAGMVVQTWGQRWSGDYWAHRGAVLELSTDPWSPMNPFVGSSAPDPNLSPYTLVLGLAARVTGAGVADVLSVAAVFNVVLFLAGLHRFVSRFSAAPLAPLWTLLATLFLWGWAPWRWSGYLSANSIGFGLPYPSMFAAGALLFALAALVDFCDTGRRGHLVAVVALAPLVVLSHPFTGAAMAVAGPAIVMSRLGAVPLHRLTALGAGATVVAALVLAWPLYPALDLLGATSSYDDVHTLLYRQVGARTVLALIAVPALVGRQRRDRRDPLALTFGAATIVFALGWLTQRESLGRMLPLAMLALHCALGIWLAERGASWWRRSTGATRMASAGIGSAAVLVGVLGCAGGLARAIPTALLPARVAEDSRLDADDGGLTFLAAMTSPDDVLLAATQEAARVSPALGAKVVVPGYVAPFIDDLERRRADVARFFATRSPAERRAVVERYDASFVLFDLRFDTPDAVLGEVVYRDSRYALVAVGSP